MTALRMLPRQVTAAATLALSLALAAPQPAVAVPEDFSEIANEKLPAVVGILSTRSDPPHANSAERPQLPPGLEEFFGMPGPGPAPRGGSPEQMRAQGSGFIISADGFVVTNNHVIEGAEEIEVVLEDERRFVAALVGTDPATDIAVLKIDDAEDLPHVTWGASEALEVGDWLIAIGNPFGLGGTVTAGILSARSRNINAGPYDDFLQTDAAINRGNSGGPLFDADGQVVGVNTAIFSPSGGNVGIGFAVPSRVAEDVVAEIRDKGRVERGWLGVAIQPVTEDIAEALDIGPSGAMVTDVTPDSPADAAGLRPGDVLTAIAGQEIADPRELSFAVAEIETGAEVRATVLRDGETLEIAITVGQRPVPQSGDAPAVPEGDDTPRLGVQLAPLDMAAREELGLGADAPGVVIASVTQGSPAAEAGLRRGDVIVSAGGTDIAEAGDLRAALADADDGLLLLRVWRGGGYSFVAVRLDASDG